MPRVHSVRAVIRDYQLSGVDSLEEEMLLGPAMTIPRLLQRNGLTFADVDVWEIHEAFATQVLINRACMASPAFVEERFGAGFPSGEIPLEKLNPWGGSLSMGNPFAATGVRLFQTAAQRMLRFNQRYAVISTCAGFVRIESDNLTISGGMVAEKNSVCLRVGNFAITFFTSLIKPISNIRSASSNTKNLMFEISTWR